MISTNTFSRDLGQTEITTDEGIEVFQDEKYYLLKKNVHIISDNFELKADKVKAYFEKDLYDIVKIESEKNASLFSSNGIRANGNIIIFSIKNETIEVLGKKSSLIFNNILMNSDQMIKVNNLDGSFYLKGNDSKLENENIYILGDMIEGKYTTINKVNEISNLLVIDDNQLNIKTSKLNMYASKATYNKKDNITELTDNVKIIRDNEIITGDYAKINMIKQSYKVISDKSSKVKILISEKTNE